MPKGKKAAKPKEIKKAAPIKPSAPKAPVAPKRVERNPTLELFNQFKGLANGEARFVAVSRGLFSSKGKARDYWVKNNGNEI